MIPRELIASAAVPGGGELRLVRRGEEYSIMLGANELMNSRLSGSEEALAALACAKLAAVDRPRILIGGLGMGFTLRAALADLPPGAKVTVCELVPEVVKWARGPMAELFAGSLEDSRTSLVEEDVIPAGEAAKGYVAITTQASGTAYPVIQEVVVSRSENGTWLIDSSTDTGEPCAG